MQVLVIASRKGGVGKTTLAGHLAVAATQAGAGPVVLIDTDPQASLAAWWNARAAQEPGFAQADIADLAEQIEALRAAGARLVVIDTPPAIGDTIAQVVALADLVLIPTRPSPHDLRSIGSTVELVEAAGRRLAFVINGAAHRARLTAQAAIELSAFGAVAPAVLHQRTDFASSMIAGETAQELDSNSKSATEVRALWTFTAGLLGKTGKPKTPRR